MERGGPDGAIASAFKHFMKVKHRHSPATLCAATPPTVSLLRERRGNLVLLSFVKALCKNLDLNERCRQIHGPWLKEMYVPSGNEMLYMNMGAMAGGYPGFGLFILTL